MWTYLWQNFLKDSKVKVYIQAKISKLYSSLACSSILEIWPGKWALTKRISSITDNLVLIEKDSTLVPILEEKKQEWVLSFSQLINKDILEVDNIEDLINPQNTIVVGNLPYYITSPIISKFFANSQQLFPWWFFMIQKEVWDKLDHEANKKSYLWRLINFAYIVKYEKTISQNAFSPPPKVKSCLISITPKNKEDIPNLNLQQVIDFLNLFNQFSRKTLWASYKILAKKWIKIDFSIPEKLAKKRLEELSRNNLEEILN